MIHAKVTAYMANELAGAPPQLDALLIKMRAGYHVSAGPHERYDPAPAMDLMPPCVIHREMIMGQFIHHVSSPIVMDEESDRHERIGQHFPREYSRSLSAKERTTIATTNGAQKSMYLPIRRRFIRRIVWFAALNQKRSRLRRELRQITHVGQDRSRGCGRVERWEVEAIEGDFSFFAPHPDGQVLMRQLPFGDYLPPDLIGFVRDFDAVTVPYWHPERKMEIVRPC